MLACVGLLMLHEPPGVGSVTVAVDPTHTADAPEMADGSGFTVTVTEPVIVFWQPVVVLCPITV